MRGARRPSRWGSAKLALSAVLVTVVATVTLGVTAGPATASSSLSGTTAATPPTVDAAPLVSVETMAKVGETWGVLLDPHRATPLPGCPDVIAEPSGDACFYAEPKASDKANQGWVQLVVLKRSDLSLVANNVLQCFTATAYPNDLAFDGFGSSDPGNQFCMTPLSNFIGGLDSSDIVIAVNQPDLAPPVGQDAPPVGLSPVLGGVGSFHGIGIMPTWYDHRASLPNKTVRGTFSAIGVPGWKSGGLSNQSDKPDQWGSGSLSADLVVNNQALYAPVSPGSAADAVQSPINKVLVQAPTAWPAATRGQSLALTAVGEIVGLGSDPRAQFYSSTKSNAEWVEVQRRIEALKYSDLPSGITGISPTDLEWAKSELDQEIGYVVDVNSYTQALAAPFQGASPALWSTFGQVVDAVNTGTANGNSAQVVERAAAVLSAIIDVAHVVPGAGKAADIAGAAYSLALDWAASGSEQADAPFSTQAAQLGSVLQDRLDTAQQEIQVRWRNVVVADYGKLKTVALCSTSARACPDDSPGWSISINDNTHMETALKLGLQREMYSTLVPAKYTVALHLGGGKGHENPPPDQAKDLTNWCQPIPPFDNSTGAVLLGSSSDPRSVFVLTNIEPDVTKPWRALSRTVMDRMFDPVDPGGNYDRGGLGLSEGAWFYAAYPTARIADSEHFLKFALCGWK